MLGTLSCSLTSGGAPCSETVDKRALEMNQILRCMQHIKHMVAQNIVAPMIPKSE